jgi:hypothetical protein
MQMPWAKLPCRHRRSKGEYLDSVEAPDRERAEAVAINQFAMVCFTSSAQSPTRKAAQTSSKATPRTRP